jgi:hypothetical protein
MSAQVDIEITLTEEDLMEYYGAYSLEDLDRID